MYATFHSESRSSLWNAMAENTEDVKTQYQNI